MNDIFIICKAHNKRFAIIDLEDYERCKSMPWGIKETGYVQCSLTGKNKGKTLSLHRFIVLTHDTEIIHHKNGYKFDNRKCNLISITQSLNIQYRGKLKTNSTSKYLGVSKRKGAKVWEVYCGDKKKTHTYVGCFFYEIDAALAYDTTARVKYGTTAATNFCIC